MSVIRRIHQRSIPFVLIPILSCGGGTVATVARADVDSAKVQQAIDRGVAYLRGSQTQRGHWNEFGSQSCGLTALCTLSLLTAGLPPDDPAMIRALAYLRTFQPKETYSVALQTLVFCQVGAAGDLPKIRRNVQWLIDNQKDVQSRRAGAWDYGNGQGSGDPSNSQFAILALGAAVERGVKVDESTFRLAGDYWRAIQLSRGGWSYGGLQPSGSMTCAGIGSLLIARASMARPMGRSLSCCGEEENDDAIQRGLAYLGDIFSVRENPGAELRSQYYYLYAVERVGRLSGRRLIGNRDWYREGAEELLARQDTFQGFWQGDGIVENNRDIATSFAVLFLSKGKRQVVIGRLEDSGPAVNQPGGGAEKLDVVASSVPHAEALRQLVRHVERDWSRDLTWQTINASQAGVADLLQTPVLLIGGRSRLTLNQSVRDSLKEYLEQGGTILFDAQAGDGCGDAAAFQASVVELCRQWYPETSLQRLPPSHPIWFAERPADPTAIGEDYWVYGLGACCRTPIFFSPKSLSCRWAHGDQWWGTGTPTGAVAADIAAGIAIGENLIAYATGRELKDKLEASEFLDGRDAPSPTRGAIPIATAALGAGEDQAMRVLPNAASLIRERLSVEVIAVGEPIMLTAESLARVGVLYLHGQTEFELTQQSRDALKVYLERNGLVIAAPICGNEAFAASFRREMALVLPNVTWEPMAADHPAWTTRYGGYDLGNVTIRTPGQRTTPAQAGASADGTIRVDKGLPRPPGNSEGAITIARRRGAPLIEVAQVNRRDAVFYSPQDLSCALESQNSIQCPGYPTSDAAKIIAGLILYGLQQ